MNELIKNLIHEIDSQLEKKNSVILGIEGRSAAGKTTLAQWLSGQCACNVFHMDDFFLRPEQRTPERYAQPGGNVDYERFQLEILNRLHCGMPIFFRKFDCSSMTLLEPEKVEPARLTVIEGVYCMHPFFQDPYDIHIFLDIEGREQKKRIAGRNSKALYKRFLEEWIPYEESYFEAFQIREECDFKFLLRTAAALE